MYNINIILSLTSGVATLNYDDIVILQRNTALPYVLIWDTRKKIDDECTRVRHKPQLHKNYIVYIKFILILSALCIMYTTCFPCLESAIIVD